MYNEFLKNPSHKIASLLLSRDFSDLNVIEVNKLLSKVEHDEFFKLCKDNEIASIVYKDLHKTNIKVSEDWENEYEKVNCRISKMFVELEILGQSFSKSELKVVVLKNGGIAQFEGASYAEHPMGDIDLFVDKKDFEEAHKCIISNGFTLKFRSEFEEDDYKAALVNGATEYYKELDDGQFMWLELSDRAVSGRWINPENEPKSLDLIQNAYEGRVRGTYILSPEDNLLQVSLHTAKHSYFRAPGFRLHLDVLRISKNFKINWHEFLNKVNNANSKTSIYFSLLLAKKILNADIPEFVLKALYPGIIKEKLVLSLLRNVTLSKRFEFNRISFIFFQVLLYDRFVDIINVALPSSEEIKLKYKNRNVAIGYIIHILDLVGVRKKFKK